jgi:hypothetical protein
LVNLNDAWSRIRKAAGLNDLRIHDLRRTVGSWLVRDGASLHLVGSLLNHKDQKTTAGYAYFQTKERHKALDKLAGTSSTSHLACQRHPQTPATGYPKLRSFLLPIAGPFTPLREKRSISLYGRSPLELYQNGSAYRMWVLPKCVDARISQLPIEGTGREWPPDRGAKRQPCRC